MILMHVSRSSGAIVSRYRPVLSRKEARACATIIPWVRMLETYARNPTFFRHVLCPIAQCTRRKRHLLGCSVSTRDRLPTTWHWRETTRRNVPLGLHVTITPKIPGIHPENARSVSGLLACMGRTLSPYRAQGRPGRRAPRAMPGTSAHRAPMVSSVALPLGAPAGRPGGGPRAPGGTCHTFACKEE